MNTRVANSVVALLATTAPAIAIVAAEPREQRPNILVVTCEDISPYLGCYGDKVAKSPNLDSFSSEAIRHTNMYTTVGVSSPSRYSLITGRYSSVDGANYMRINHFDKSFEVVSPAGVKCYTEYLRAAGYYCTNNNKTDYQFTSPLSVWDDCGVKAHWHNAPEGAPFYAIFNLNATHESVIWKNTDAELFVKPEDVVLPPYYPDNEIVRHDMAVMYSNIARMDRLFQQLYDELKQRDKLDNTIVIFYSDNGGPTPRGKRELLDSGTNVPFMIRFPDGTGAGTLCTDMNMFVDIPATILSLAGLEVPKNMHGRAMYGDYKGEKRDFVFGATDRFDEQIEKRASIRDERFLYVKNYMPNQSTYRPVQYRLQMPMMRNMLELYSAGKLDEVQAQWFETPEYDEQLFDCQADPHNVHNLVGDKRYAKRLRMMRKSFNKEWIDKYNYEWVKFDESDFTQRMRPDGVKRVCPQAQYIIENGVLRLTNLDDCYSAVYRNVGDVQWRIYAGEITLSPSQSVEVRLCRIGFSDSEPQIIGEL